jgi:type III pantothenate kinase
MLLLIDAGNTRLKWAVAPLAGAVDAAMSGADDWLACHALAHAEIAGVAAAWAGFPLTAVLISNVAGPALAARISAELAALRMTDGSAPPVRWFASEAVIAGVRNGYRPPEKLGCDRLAALIGARALMPQRDLIVATCGTATTVDALRADGMFVGGLILPGLATMARSLAHGTALLPNLADLVASPGHNLVLSPVLNPVADCGTRAGEAAGAAQPIDPSPAAHAAAFFADHTDAAIRNGCLAAQAGAIERAVAAHGNAYCLISGGAAAWVSTALQVPHAVRDNLVLAGLQVVARSQPGWPGTAVLQPDMAGSAPRPEA